MRYGYGHMTEARFLLLRVADPGAARAWLRTAPVTTAQPDACPGPRRRSRWRSRAEGLEALGRPGRDRPGLLGRVPGRHGRRGEPLPPARRRRRERPSGWEWGGPGRVPHVLVMLYAEPGQLEPWKRTVTRDRLGAAFAGAPAVRPLRRSTASSRSASSTASASRSWTGSGAAISTARDLLEYGNVCSLGEVLLGYPNEYGRTPTAAARPAGRPRAAPLPAAEDAPGRRDLGRNGSYLVFRQLRQDVRGFWHFLQRQATATRRRGARWPRRWSGGR